MFVNSATCSGSAGSTSPPPWSRSSAVLLLGILDGVIFAVVASLVMLLQRTSTPPRRLPRATSRHQPFFQDLARHPDNEPIPAACSPSGSRPRCCISTWNTSCATCSSACAEAAPGLKLRHRRPVQLPLRGPGRGADASPAWHDELERAENRIARGRGPRDPGATSCAPRPRNWSDPCNGPCCWPTLLLNLNKAKLQRHHDWAGQQGRLASNNQQTLMKTLPVPLVLTAILLAMPSGWRANFRQQPLRKRTAFRAEMRQMQQDAPAAGAIPGRQRLRRIGDRRLAHRSGQCQRRRPLGPTHRRPSPSGIRFLRSSSSARILESRDRARGAGAEPAASRNACQQALEIVLWTSAAVFRAGYGRDDRAYLQVVHGKKNGSPPRCDLEVAKTLHTTLIGLIQSGLVKSAHDCSEGGLAVALAESCISQLIARETPRLIGASVDLSSFKIQVSSVQGAASAQLETENSKLEPPGWTPCSSAKRNRASSSVAKRSTP